MLVKWFRQRDRSPEEPTIDLSLKALDKRLDRACRRAKRHKDAEAAHDVASFLRDFIANTSVIKRRQFVRLRKLLPLLPKEEARTLMTEAVNSLNAYEVDQEVIKHGREYEDLPQLSSFRACLALRSRRLWLAGGDNCPEWAVEDKTRAFRYADLLSVRRPWQSTVFDIDEVQFKPGHVYKPRVGAAARGVYLAQSDDRFFDVSRSTPYTRWSEVYARMCQDVEDGWVKTRSWLMEELIQDSSQEGGVSRDLKFLCFYGKAVLVREFSRYPERSAISWDAEGQVVQDGLEKEAPVLSSTTPPDAEAYALAERISLSIPAPFIRIDFMTSDEGLVLNEFTPRPGTFAKFNRDWDRLLGDEYLKAEVRLHQDLLAGKVFETFNQFLGKG